MGKKDRQTVSSDSSNSDSSSVFDSNFQEFSVGNFENLSGVTEKLTLEQKQDLSDLLTEVAEVSYKNKELMDWVFNQKVQRSSQPSELFRGDGSIQESMEFTVGNALRMRFGCVRWLTSMVGQTLKFLAENTGKADQKEKAAEFILDRYVDGVYDIPVWLRQSCNYFRGLVKSKFGIDAPDPLLDIVSSALLAASEGEGKIYKDQLLYVASIANMIGRIKTDYPDQATKNFVEQKIEKMKSFYDELLDPQAIAMAENIVNSSKPHSMSMDIFLRAKLRKYNRILQNTNSENSSVTSGIEEVTEKDVANLIKKMESSAWRYDKTWNHGVMSYILKSEESTFFAMKTEFRIKAKLVEVATYMMENQAKPESDPDITNSTTKNVGDGIMWTWGWGDMPWPIADRAFSFYQHEFIDLSNNQIVYITANAPYPGGVRKKSVLTRIFLSGSRFVQDANDPEYIHVTYVLHADPGGLFPAWLANKNCRRQFAKTPRMIDNFLKYLQQKNKN